MTYSPRFWTDPLSGASYAAGNQLTAAQMNVYRTSMLNEEKHKERRIALNWPIHVFPVTDDYRATSCVTWVPTSQVWVEGMQAAPPNGANPSCRRFYTAHGEKVEKTVAAGDGLTVCNITAHNNIVVMCGLPGSSSVKRYRASADGGLTWSVGSSPSASTYAVRTVSYSTVASKFLAGDAQGKVELSSDGVTWTAAATPPNVDIARIESNSTLSVAVLNTDTNKCWTSSAGSIWTQRTMASTATWYSVCWVPNQQTWIAFGDAGTCNTSSDGITWVNQTGASAIAASYAVSTGNIVVANDGQYIWMTDDLGATWRPVIDYDFITGAFFGLGAATDPDGKVCQLLTIGCEQDGTYFPGTHYFASEIGS